jgi:hypothetical protein
MHTDTQYKFGRLHENGSTERKRQGVVDALFFSFWPKSCGHSVSTKIDDVLSSTAVVEKITTCCLPSLHKTAQNNPLFSLVIS